MRVHVLLVGTVIALALRGSDMLPIADINWLDGCLRADDLPRHLLVLPVRVGNL